MQRGTFYTKHFGAGSQIKFFILLLTVIVFVLCIFGCRSSQKKPSGLEELDNAVREASNYLNNNLPRGSRLVILNFQSESQVLSEYVMDELISNIVNDRIFTVVDRANLASIQREINFQPYGEVDTETAVSIGQMLEAQTIVSGSIAQIGDLFRLRVRALDVDTAQISGQFNRNIPGDQALALLMNNNQQTPGLGQPSRIQSGSSQPAVLYRIGDTGPAGGIIFYDKGNSNGGWRYLEAAPQETEVSAITFSPSGHNALIGSRGIGDGIENTNKFIELFQRTGEGINTAPWICNELNINGFNDWYLPSPDELLLMYNNLYSRRLGELRSSVYWSSFVNEWWHTFAINFYNGSEVRLVLPDSVRYQVRAVRQF